MAGIDLVKKFLDAFEFAEFDKFDQCLAEGFTFNAGMARPLDKQQYLLLAEALYAAFPDWQFNARYFEEEGDTVRMTFQITGTHTGDLDLSSLGMPSVSATNRPVSLPGEHPVVVVRGNEIHRIEIPPVSGGGIPGLLGQLGARMPGV